jgi:dipeptidyl aminopeptidase/acylaminoacyl peptidase
MGCGHKAYMREIVTLAEHGYAVFTYDHTGTLASGGDSIGGFTQSLVDLDRAMCALKASGKVDGKTIVVMGHSWGGFSTMNIGAFHPEITHLVAMSGFTSPTNIITDVLGKMKKYAPAITRSELDYFGGYALADASLSLLETDARALIVHSKDDNTVPFHRFVELQERLKGVDRVRFMPVEGKKHNPNYTSEAVSYKDLFSAEHARFKKNKRASKEDVAAFVASWDWYKMTEQDMEFWDTVFEFIDK